MSSNTAIVAFVGQNENGILRHLSRGLMSLLEPHGYQGHILDLGDPTWPAQLDRLAQQGIAMAWGHAGVGAKLEINGKPYWDRLKIPFVSVLADSPCWRPCNHNVPSTFVVNAYLYREWLRIQREFIRAPQFSTLVQGGLIPNPARDAIPWRDRPRRMVFVKTGGDPEARRATWQNFPRRWRAILEDAAAVATSQPTGDITDIALTAFEAHNIAPEQRTELLFALMFELDLYVRDSRSTKLVTALLDLPVDIYGRGWDHVSARATRARFHPAFDADALPRVYAETQFILNTTPNFSSNVHERVAYGLDAKCCVVSDENDFMKRKLADIPTFFGIDPNAPDLPARLADIHNDPTDYTDAMQPALDLVAREFDGERYMLSLLDLATEARTAEQLANYRI
jgi:hypothetical protein